MNDDLKKVPPDQIMNIMRQINESMFGSRKWNEMVKKADDDMKQLIGLGAISRRDKIILNFALHMGVKYGIAYSHALRKAQNPLRVIMSFFTRKTRK